MPETVTKVKLFVASPSDVQKERDSISEVLGEINQGIGRYLRFFVECVMWETHCHPAMGRPQGVINAQIGAYDIFVGIMWKRFGSPTGTAESGTQEEFNLAYERWKSDNNFPVLFYFSQAQYTPSSIGEMKQAAKVLVFKEQLAKKGLVWDYANADSFPGVLRRHLTDIFFEMFKERYSVPNLSPSVVRQSVPSQQQTMSLLNWIKQRLRTAGWL